MANRLRDLEVNWVSLVDRAAVRRADDPTEPQRWLLFKRDNTNGGSSMSEIEQGLAEATALAKSEQAEHGTVTEPVRKSLSDAQLRYLREVSPRGAAIYEDSRAALLAKGDAGKPTRSPTVRDEEEDPDGEDEREAERQVRQVVDNAGITLDDQLTRKAEQLRKADPTISEWEALEQARRADPQAQAHHLERPH